jgi:hypothetical protein
MTVSYEVVLPAQEHPGGLELEGKRQKIRRDSGGSKRDATKNDEAHIGASAEQS